MLHTISEETAKNVIQKGAQALFSYCKRNNIHYVITGSSGGLDSTVTLGIAHRACLVAQEQDFSLTSVATILPCESSIQSKELGKLAAKRFSAVIIYDELDGVFKTLNNELDLINNSLRDSFPKFAYHKIEKDWTWSKQVAQGNVKTRMRMIVNYHIARMLEGMVLSTDNLSEFWMAFWTICGDVGDFGIIQNVLKGSELTTIAKVLDAPQEIIQAKPDDGLNIAGGDEAQLGASYPVIDHVMISLIKQGFDLNGSLDQLNELPTVSGIDPQTVVSLATRCLRGSYKRQGTIVLSREELGLVPISQI